MSFTSWPCRWQVAYAEIVAGDKEGIQCESTASRGVTLEAVLVSGGLENSSNLIQGFKKAKGLGSL